MYTGLFLYASDTSLILRIFEMPDISGKWAVGPTVSQLVSVNGMEDTDL